MQAITALANQYHALLIVIGLIGLDTVLGWLIALSQGKFDFAKADQYLATKVLPYVGGLVVLSIAANLYPQLNVALPVSYVAVAAHVAKDVISKVKGLGISVNFNQPPTPPQG